MTGPKRMNTARIRTVACVVLLASIVLHVTSMYTDRWLIITNRCINYERYWKGIWVECVNYQRVTRESRVPSCVDCRDCPCPCNFTLPDIACGKFGSNPHVKLMVRSRFHEPRGN